MRPNGTSNVVLSVVNDINDNVILLLQMILMTVINTIINDKEQLKVDLMGTFINIINHSIIHNYSHSIGSVLMRWLTIMNDNEDS